MYSERDTKTNKTRTIGISILMLISVVTPLATTVTANHDQPEPLALEMLDGNGTWVEVPEDSDPMIDGFMEAGTYEFRFTSNNLTTNDDYALEWMVEYNNGQLSDGWGENGWDDLDFEHGGKTYWVRWAETEPEVLVRELDPDAVAEEKKAASAELAQTVEDIDSKVDKTINRMT